MKSSVRLVCIWKISNISLKIIKDLQDFVTHLRFPDYFFTSCSTNFFHVKLLELIEICK